jgi:two-component system phosphate regulon response regulator OmpR
MKSSISQFPPLLIVDDDVRLRHLLETYLRENDFTVESVENASQAREKIKKNSFGLIILDIMMPGETGLEFIESLRKEPAYASLPVLLLTALGEVDHRIRGFEKGADEYLAKPFEPKELVLRIKNIFKRTPHLSALNRIGDFHFDMQKKTLRKGEELITLTSTEAELLYFLVLNKGTVVSRYALSDYLVGTVSPRTIDVQITRLRRKIEKDSRFPQFIQTVRHKGYLLCCEE